MGEWKGGLAPIAERSRSGLITETLRAAPEPSQWAEVCYWEPSQLRIRENCIASKHRVQPGESMGPAMFSLAVHPTIPTAKAEAAVVIGRALASNFFLDDGVGAGGVAIVSAWHRAVRRELAAIILYVNASSSREEGLLSTTSMTNSTPTFLLFPPFAQETSSCSALLPLRMSRATKSLPSTRPRSNKTSHSWEP